MTLRTPVVCIKCDICSFHSHINVTTLRHTGWYGYRYASLCSGRESTECIPGNRLGWAITRQTKPCQNEMALRYRDIKFWGNWKKVVSGIVQTPNTQMEHYKRMGVFVVVVVVVFVMCVHGNIMNSVRSYVILANGDKIYHGIGMNSPMVPNVSVCAVRK